MPKKKEWTKDSVGGLPTGAEADRDSSKVQLLEINQTGILGPIKGDSV